MNRIKPGGRPAYLAMACAATALLASGCNRTQTEASNTTAPPLDALPLATADTAPAAPAPAASALPSARPARIGRLARPQDGYAYLDRAYAASDGYAGAPPDYAVDYNGERPWIWRGGDNSERVVERTPEGLRYYYYEPGASEPYLVQDPNYGYAYSDGQLVAVYGSDGQLEPYDYQQRYADRAGRYLAWAAGLYAASVHQQRFAVEQDRWRQQQTYIAGQRNAWAQQQARYPAWNDYHQAHAQEEAAHWAPERDRRQAEIVRYTSINQNNTYQNSNYQSNNYQNNTYQNNTYRGGPPQAAALQGPDGGPYRQAVQQTYGQPGERPIGGGAPGGYGYDRNAAMQAEANRRAGFDQHAADVQAQRQAAEQAHAAQFQAQQAQQAQARAAEAQRQAALQQGRAAEQAQRQAAEQAHANQLQAMRSQQMQARAAEDQRQAALQQGRAEAEAQRQAAQQAHAAQISQARTQAEAQRQAAAQQARLAQVQAQAAQHAAQAHPGAPPQQPHPHDGPRGDHERHEPGEQR